MSRRNYFTIVSVFALVGLSMFTYVRSLNSLEAQTVKPVEVDKEVVRGSPQKVMKSPEEWKKTLTPEQYKILRETGTEAPYGKAYNEFKHQGEGTYLCSGCDTELFSSKEKFDSKCGWPSFYDPSKAKNVKLSVDYLLGYPRTEVRCVVCDGHLGHVFKGEGYDTPTDKRFCINGTVLKFVPAKKNIAPVKNPPPQGK
jgi:peptide-methionine (R)-S-oxide reductase